MSFLCSGSCEHEGYEASQAFTEGRSCWGGRRGLNVEKFYLGVQFLESVKIVFFIVSKL